MANFMLQPFKIDFDRIGSLPTPKTKFPVTIRPLVKTSSDWDITFYCLFLW